jgi:predicted methyltransferase
VQSAVQNYVDLQTKNMENYLPDQYEIAKNAVVKTLKSGEVLAVMAPDSATLAPALEKALK